MVKESRAAYRKPVIGDLRAICERPAQAAIAEFKEALGRYGKAKLKLRARVIEAGETAVDVQAAFVVSRLAPPHEDNRPTGRLRPLP